jgi:hypothetical protein
MTNKSYVFITGFLFCLFALLHLLRLIFSLPVEVDARTIPVWVSWIPFVGASLLSVWAVRLSRTRNKS